MGLFFSTNFEIFCKTDDFNERCYKKPCVGATTTTTTCVLDDLVFLDNGCCRFNHLSQTNHGAGHIEAKSAQTEETCLAYCNEDLRCIAVDVRYPDPYLPFLEENATYVCYNFYGSADHWLTMETFCKTNNYNERCYKKPCTTATTTCVYEGGHIEAKGAQTEEACLAYCNEDPRCMAADVRYPDPLLPFLEENVAYGCCKCQSGFRIWKARAHH